MVTRTLAVVGAAGGVGTTRLAVESGAGLAADGRDTVVLDAALATQGMSAYVPGRIEPDITTVLIDEAELPAALHDHPADTPGRLALCPAHAPFTRLAEAEAVEVASGFDTVLEAAGSVGEHVVIDVPPIASNIAVGAVAAADRVAVVTTPTDRGRDALSRCRGRLADIGAAADFVVGNFVDEEGFPDGDVSIPTSREHDVPETPTVLQGEDGFGPGVGALLEAGFETSLSVSFDSTIVDTAREFLS